MLLFHMIPVQSVISHLGNLNTLWCAAGLLVQLLVRTLGALNLYTLSLSQGHHVSFGTAFVILLTTGFYSLILPGAVATGAVTWLKYREAGVDAAGAAIIIVANRGLNLAICLMLGGLAAAWDPQLPFQQQLPGLGFALFLLCVFCGLFFLLFNFGTSQPVHRPTMGERLRRLLTLSRAVRARLLITHALHVVSGATAIWCFSQALGLTLAWSSSLWIYALLQTAMLLPITVAGIGVRDGTLLGAGVLLGLTTPQALAWSMTLLASTLLFGLIGALLEIAPRFAKVARSEL